MKKALTRTIIVCVALNLMTAGFVLAQNAAEEADLIQIQKQIPQMEMDEMMMMGPPRVSVPGWQYSGIGSILVIPTAQMKTEDLAAITEDMSVMSRIFDKKLSQARLTTGRGGWFVGLDPLFGRDSRTTEAIYLEGYGALFLMKVNVLLSPPPETQQEKETEEEDTDPLWTETIQEMYAPQDTRRRRGDRPEEKYDAEKVKDLKETLIKTLKHAANIRALKPDESVILTVIGKAGQSANIIIEKIPETNKVLVKGEDKKARIYVGGLPSNLAFSSPTVLTIRAKKSDIDAFAKGQLTFDQFRQKTRLLSYSYLTENLGDRQSRYRLSGRSGMGDLMGSRSRRGDSRSGRR